MKTHKLLILSFLVLLVHAAEWSIPLKNEASDYGCGSKNMMLYYPLGLPGGVECFVGHANPLTRNDRVLMRFDLGEYYLLEQLPELQSAWLEFTIQYSVNAEGHVLVIEHLDYERDALAKEDLATDSATAVAQAPIAERRHRIDVTDAVRGDLSARNLYAAFRFSSTCGNAPNETAQPIGCRIRTDLGAPAEVPRLVLVFP